MTRDKAMVIDGNAFIYRVFFAIQKQNCDYVGSENLQSITLILKRMIQKCRLFGDYRYSVVSFDSTRDTFRRSKFSGYKSNRSPMPNSLFQIMSILQNEFEKEGCIVVKAPKPYEGDDVIATISEIFTRNNVFVDIFSVDKDLLQLVSPDVSVHLLRAKGKVLTYNDANFLQLNEDLFPWQIPHYKALAGDSSDNYGGVFGIGPRTARDLLINYGSLEGIYENIDSIQEKFRNNLIENRESAFKCYELAKLVRNVQISNNLEDYESTSRIRKCWE